MFKKISTGDILKNNPSININNSIELIQNDDYYTDKTFNRALSNIYSNTEELHNFIKLLPLNSGFLSGYEISTDTFPQLFYSQPAFSRFVGTPEQIDYPAKKYFRFPSGIAFYNKNLVVNTIDGPTIARQIKQKLNLLDEERDHVFVKTKEDTVKFKIIMGDIFPNETVYYFGCANETEWEDDTTFAHIFPTLQAITNQFDNKLIYLNEFAIGPVFEISADGTYRASITENDFIFNTLPFNVDTQLPVATAVITGETAVITDEREFAPGQPVSPAGSFLEGYWNNDANEAAITPDYSSKERLATKNCTTGYGAYGYAFKIENSTHRVETITDAPNLNVKGSILCYFNATNTTGTKVICDKSSGGTVHYRIAIVNGALEASVENTKTVIQTILPNKDYEVLFTWDGVFHRLYINGYLVKRTASTVVPQATAAKFAVGNTVGGSSSNFLGIIGNVRLYSINLSKEEALGAYLFKQVEKDPVSIMKQHFANTPETYFKNDIVVDGNLTVNGTTTTFNTQTLEVEDNIIQINKNQTEVPPATLFSGIEVNRGPLENYVFLFRESDDTFVIGTVADVNNITSDNLQAVATREDNPTDQKLMFWNNTATRIDTDGDITRGVNTLSITKPETSITKKLTVGTTDTDDLVIKSVLTDDLYFKNDTNKILSIKPLLNTGGRQLTIKAGDSGAGTNLAGGNLILGSGNSTGTGVSTISFHISSGGTTGTTVRTVAERFRISGTTTDTNLTLPASGTVNFTTGSNNSKTINLFSESTISGQTKTISIGSGGVNGSITNITIGSSVATEGTTTIYSPSFSVISSNVSLGGIAGTTTINNPTFTVSSTTLNLGSSGAGTVSNINSETLNIKKAVSTGDFDTTGVLTITNDTQAVDAYSGALKVKGGASFEKDVFIGGNLQALGTFSTAGTIVNGNLEVSNDITAGSGTKTSNTIIRALSADTHNAGFEAYGNSQGTGYVYVGENANNGGGIFYNGDGTPTFATGEGADRVSFYRRSASANEVVFSYAEGNNNVEFRGNVAVNGGSLTTSASTFNLVNAATAVNFAGETTTLNIGTDNSTARTFSLFGNTVVGSTTNQKNLTVYGVGTFRRTNAQDGILISPRSGGTGSFTTTITTGTLTASRTYTIPEVSANADFIMTQGNQSINGEKSFSSITSITNNTPSTSPTTGALKINGGIGVGGDTVSSGSFKIISDSIEVVRVGNDSDFGLHLYYSSVKKSITPSTSPNLIRISNPTGYMDLGAWNTTSYIFQTDRSKFLFSNLVESSFGFKIYDLAAEITSAGKLRVINNDGTVSDTVWIKDAAGYFTERTIPPVAWTNTQATNTNSNVQFNTIELGHASDTTLSRVSAGRIAVEGVNVVTESSTDTLTNKTITTIAGVAATANNLWVNTTTGNSGILTGQSSGTITIGGTAGTGLITLGRSTDTQTISIGDSATASTKTKTIKIGTGGLSGSTTNIDLGSLTSSGTITAYRPILTQASTTSTAFFSLPHGSAPTSPVNGDLWTTTSGLFARINNATVGPYSSTVGTVTSVGGTGSVNGITLTGSVTSSGNLTLGGTLENIANNQLTNSSITINGTSTSLGGSALVKTLVNNNGIAVIAGEIEASPTNYLQVTPGASASPVNISTVGVIDANVSLEINTKGNGNIILDTGTGTGDIELKPGTSNLRLYDDDSSHYYRFITGNRTANYDITLPAASGTMAYTNASSFTSLVNINSSTSATTTQIAYGANASGVTKTIRIGTGGVSGSITNIELGSAVSGATGSIIANHKLSLTASTTTSASLNIPAGTAPTSPVVGDIWATNTGVYARIGSNDIPLAETGSFSHGHNDTTTLPASRFAAVRVTPNDSTAGCQMIYNSTTETLDFIFA